MTTAVVAPAVSLRSEPTGYIASPAYDIGFFIAAPLFALVLSIALGALAFPFEQTEALGYVDMRIAIFLGVWNAAHLIAVVFRSHLNPAIFRRHPVRFVVVPPVLLCGFILSDWALALGFFAAALWDVYHSSLQTFGLGRIYDARRGNPAEVGRRLDWWLCHLIYIGPILGGLSLPKTLEQVRRFSDLGWGGPARAVAEIDAFQAWARPLLIVGGLLFVAFYAWRYRALWRSGYRPAPQKLVLLGTTALTTICAWGFLPPLQAFFVANFFHPLQYFGIVWWSEGGRLRRSLGVEAHPFGSVLALLVCAGALGALGCAYLAGDHSGIRWAMSAVLVTALMHFWYDGFIWSVRRGEV